LKISLIIPVRNEVASIGPLLVSMFSQTRRADQVILVDGGSTDGTIALLRATQAQGREVRVLEAGDATPGRGRNVGAASAQYEWIAFTDAGLQLEPEWLARLVEVAERDNCDVVYGNYEPVTETRFERCAALAYVPPKQQTPGGVMRGRSTASMLLRRDVWRAVGGFPDLRAAEDLIFMERIERAGFKIGWASQATVWWQLRPDWVSTFRKFVLYSKHNVWAGMQRHWHYGIARQYVVWVVFVMLAMWQSGWWLVVPVLGLLARTAKSIWIRREGRGLGWALNPMQFLGVLGILLTIDLATFIGWAQARLSKRTERSGFQLEEQEKMSG
jgi:glycosyltransferase involved in cell wall biosynthesis